jgi:hypothetical protein
MSSHYTDVKLVFFGKETSLKIAKSSFQDIVHNLKEEAKHNLERGDIDLAKDLLEDALAVEGVIEGLDEEIEHWTEK